MGAIMAFENNTERERVVEEELKASEAKYRDLYDNDPIMHVSVDAETAAIRDCNQTLATALGYTKEEIIGRSIFEVYHPDCMEDVKKAFQSFVESGEVKDAELQLKRSDGSKIDVNLNVTAVRDNEGKILYSRSSWADITARKRAEEALRKAQHGLEEKVKERTAELSKSSILLKQEVTQRKRVDEELRKSEDRFRLAFKDNPIGMVLVGLDYRFFKVNKALCEMLGYTEQELTALSFVDITHPEDVEKDVQLSERVFKGEIPSYKLEKRYITKSGEILWVDLTATVIRDQDGSALYGLGMIENITKRKQAEEIITYQAYHDVLTSLPNRALFLDRLTQVLTRALWHKRLVPVLFLDLDHFKRINDTLGHSVGDLLLKAVAEQLTTCVREGDTVARLGGDEFVVALADVARAEDVTKVAQKIINALYEPFLLEGRELFITASIGISVYPNDAQDAETLIKNADMAMYRAKEYGRNNYQHFSAF